MQERGAAAWSLEEVVEWARLLHVPGPLPALEEGGEKMRGGDVLNTDRDYGIVRRRGSHCRAILEHPINEVSRIV